MARKSCASKKKLIWARPPLPRRRKTTQRTRLRCGVPEKRCRSRILPTLPACHRWARRHNRAPVRTPAPTGVLPEEKRDVSAGRAAQENCYHLIVHYLIMGTGVFEHEYQSDSRAGTNRQQRGEIRSLSIRGGSDCPGPRRSPRKTTLVLCRIACRR